MIGTVVKDLRENVQGFLLRMENQEITPYRAVKFVFSPKGILWFYGIIRKLSLYFFRLVTGQREKTDFELWLKKNRLGKKELNALSVKQASFKYKPLVSIVLPTYNTPPQYLKEAIESVFNQVYPNWELCIADDASSNTETLSYLKSIENRDEVNIIYRKQNGHISHTSNDALDSASGEYVVFLDHDDKLAPECLYSFVAQMQGADVPDFLYADEGKFNDEGKYDFAFFKPDWAPDTLESRNYILHPICVRRTLVKQVGAFTPGLEGAQDFDLVLRLTEQANLIKHIPQVLYFWRMHANSTAALEATDVKNYAFDAQKKALEAAFQRRGEDVDVEADEQWKGVFHPRYKVKGSPKVSVIIPAHNQAEITELCLTTLFENTSYPNFDVLVLSNNSSDPVFFEVLNTFAQKYPIRFKWIEQNYPFNYSKLMNAGFKEVDGELICHLNNDVEITHPDWMQRMVEQASRPEIGAVGGKLLYPNRLVQHAGVIIGLHGCAGHTFVAAKEEWGGPYFQLAANTNYAAVTGACLMVHRDKYQAVNGFDELQVVEYNDIDFCLRLLEVGYRNLYLSKVILIHHESLSRGHPHKDSASYKVHLSDVARFTKHWQTYMDNDPYYNPNLSRRHTHFLPKTFKHD